VGGLCKSYLLSIPMPKKTLKKSPQINKHFYKQTLART
jgi:hypothetical protein